MEYPSTPDAEAQLVKDCRDGVPGAIITLYRHHWEPALGFARRLSSSAHDAEDIAATAFLKSLTAIHRGKGPGGPVRPYIFKAVRTAAADHYSRTETPSSKIADVAEHGKKAYDFRSQDQEFVAEAFAALPQRWQRVLWYVEVEGLKPREAAPLLDLEPNALSALLKRARKGLRAAYLAVYIRQTPNTGCEVMLRLLSRSALGQATPGDQASVDRHARTCQDCSAALRRAGRVGMEMRSVLHPILVTTLISPVAALRILEIVTSHGHGPVQQLTTTLDQDHNPARLILRAIRAVTATAAVAALMLAPPGPGRDSRTGSIDRLHSRARPVRNRHRKPPNQGSTTHPPSRRQAIGPVASQEIRHLRRPRAAGHRQDHGSGPPGIDLIRAR